MQSKAILDRDSQIRNLDKQVSDLKLELESLKNQITEMKSEREALNKQIKMLEDQLSTTAKPRVSRGTNTKNKTKEKE